jgi:outer membrane protein OmpA-like peptidoglycan-associated protein/tetratricopeptide (TPR) repeat protein
MKSRLFKICSVALLLQLPFTGFATERPDMAKGNFYFRHNAYDDALKEYEKLVQKAPKKKDAILDARVADCYRLMKNPQQAAIWYSRALSAPKFITKETKLNYGEVLMTLGCYEDAAYWIKQYADATPANRKAASMLRGCQMAPEVLTGKPKGTAGFLAINTDGADFAPAIFNNSLVFTSNTMLTGGAKKDKWTGSNYNNIYKVTCNSSGYCGTDFQEFGGKVTSKYHDGVASFTRDHKEMYFTRTMLEQDMFGQNAVADQGVVHLEIMIAEDYNEQEKKYQKIRPFAHNSKKHSTVHPAISPDGRSLIFASDISGGEGATDLYVSARNDKGEWGVPVNLGKHINTDGEELFPVFLDNNRISFASNGHPGLGGMDVFYSSWDAASQQWSTPVNAGIPVNSSYDDMSLTMYEDGINGYFTSNRPDARQGDNIYHYYTQQLFLDAIVADSMSQAGIEGAVVTLQSDQSPQELRTGVNGSFRSELNPQMQYAISISKPGYKTLSTTLPVTKRTNVADTLKPVFRLLPDASIAYKATIVDEASGAPVEDPLLIITMDGSTMADTINLATGNPFIKTLEAGNVYRINAVKEHYYSDEKVINTMQMSSNSIITIGDTIMMCKLTVGAVCQIGDIYYDFNKADIRDDALTSLDKVIKLLKENKGLKLQINSHTDCRGTDDYNLRLSKSRADVVIKYLGSKGVGMNRLKAKGMGEKRAVNDCSDCEACSEEQHQNNRRTEFLVLEL